MLRLQAKSVVLVINFAPFAVNGAVEKVSSVELDAGLGGQYFELASAGGIVGLRREVQGNGLPGVKDPVVVVASGEL